jgi:DNA-binding transcriptional LysR family regulator
MMRWGYLDSWRRYLRQQPEVEVELALNDRVVDLLDEGFEAAIRVGALSDSGLIARPLAPYLVVFCAAPRYLGQNGIPQVPADLADHYCLDFTHSSLHGAWRFGDAQTVAARGRLRANSGQALRAAALEGVGIVMIPEVLVAEDLAAGRLVRLLPYHAPAGQPMHLFTLPDRRPTPKLRSFVTFIMARLGTASLVAAPC